MGLIWFNLSAPWIGSPMNGGIRLWNLYNRVTADGEHWWGVGLLQINHQHLFYIGSGGIRALFLGRLVI